MKKNVYTSPAGAAVTNIMCGWAKAQWGKSKSMTSSIYQLAHDATSTKFLSDNSPMALINLISHT